MEVKIALFGGVIPALILGVLMLVGAWLTRRATTPAPTTPARTAPTDPTINSIPGPTTRIARATLLAALLWILGFAIAAAFIHFASWSWPVRVTEFSFPWDFSRERLWPIDVTKRLFHTGLIIAAWCSIDICLGLFAASSASPSARPRRAIVTTLRWLGRAATIAYVLWLLIHPFERHIGQTTLLLGIAVGSALVLLNTFTTTLAQAERHPRFVWWAYFLAGLGGVVVLIVGRTATAAQASAGVAALAAATGVATLIGRRAAPGPTAAFALSALLTWLLAIGCFATGKTNLASGVLLLLAPIAWAIPRRLLDLELFWKRVPVGTIVASIWTIACVAAAVTIAVLTQDPVIPTGY